MLNNLFPRVHRRYSTLPVLGPHLDGLVAWLLDHGYDPLRVRHQIRATRRLSRELRRTGVRDVRQLTRPALRACAPASSQDDADLAVVVRLLERYLDEKGVLPPPGPPTPTELLVREYGDYLVEVRGFTPSTVVQHRWTAASFLTHVGHERAPSCLADLAANDIEGFIVTTGQRLCRASLQHVASQLRSFLRYLAGRAMAPSGLERWIDMPRVYRGEKLPRALPWETVLAFLRAIDLGSAMGLRDHAMFLLIATYGLRTSEVAALTLDDIDWRRARVRVPHIKSAAPLVLPLTDEVAASLIDYVKRGRPALAHRQVFLRVRTPAGPLKPTAVTEAFQGWTRRSGLPISFQGPHCLRHSYAVHLLRQGASLKTIGDLLGHRTAESTCVYLRLSTDDLRTVALQVPCDARSPVDQEVRP